MPQRIVWLLILSAVSFGVRAQAYEDSLLTYELGEVYIQHGEVRSPVAFQRISLAAWRTTDASNVAEAGRLIAGAHVQTNSRGETLLSLRGTSDRQVSVFLDGAPLTLPWDQRVDLGLLPSAVVGRGTVAKGNAAARFGANGYGGVLNLISRDLANDGRLIETDLLGSRPGVGRVSTTWLEQHGRWSSVVAVQRTKSDGMALAQDANLPFSQLGGDVRTNSDYALTSGFARVAYRIGESSRLGATLLAVDGEKGVPPEGHVDPTIESVRFWRYPAWNYSAVFLSGETRLNGVELRGTAWGGSASQTIERFDGQTYSVVDRAEQGDSRLVGVRVSAERIVSFGVVRGLAGWQLASYNQSVLREVEGELSLLADLNYRESRWTFGTDVEVNATPTLTLSGGVGGELLQTLEAGAVPKPDLLSAPHAHGGARFKMAEGVFVQGSAGRRTRFPSMRERYDDALGRFVVNPNLRPESAWLFDVGLTGNAASISGEFVLFARRESETIEVAVLPDGQRQRVNLGGSSAYGLEIIGVARLPQHVRLDGHLTFLRVRGFNEEVDDLQLTERPNAIGRAGLSYQSPIGLTASIESEYTGVAYSAVSEGFARLDPSVVINLRLGHRLFFPGQGLSLEVFGRVNNAFDDVVLPQIGLPAAGRTFLFGISAALG